VGFVTQHPPTGLAALLLSRVTRVRLPILRFCPSARQVVKGAERVRLVHTLLPPSAPLHRLPSLASPGFHSPPRRVLVAAAGLGGGAQRRALYLLRVLHLQTRPTGIQVHPAALAQAVHPTATPQPQPPPQRLRRLQRLQPFAVRALRARRYSRQPQPELAAQLAQAGAGESPGCR
jgi:hypothetical protein